MSFVSWVSSLIGSPSTFAGEIVIYTLTAYILLAVIEQLFGVFHAVIKVFRIR